jgi:hypothetical protein
VRQSDSRSKESRLDSAIDWYAFVVSDSTTREPMVIARKVPEGSEEYWMCRPSHPERTLATAARSHRSWSSKWERVTPGCPEPSTTASWLLLQSGCRAPKLGLSRYFDPSEIPSVRAIPGRAAV